MLCLLELFLKAIACPASLAVSLLGVPGVSSLGRRSITGIILILRVGSTLHEAFGRRLLVICGKVVC